jgi:hypothetical protein
MTRRGMQQRMQAMQGMPVDRTKRGPGNVESMTHSRRQAKMCNSPTWKNHGKCPFTRHYLYCLYEALLQ